MTHARPPACWPRRTAQESARGRERERERALPSAPTARCGADQPSSLCPRKHATTRCLVDDHVARHDALPALPLASPRFVQDSRSRPNLSGGRLDRPLPLSTRPFQSPTVPLEFGAEAGGPSCCPTPGNSGAQVLPALLLLLLHTGHGCLCAAVKLSPSALAVRPRPQPVPFLRSVPSARRCTRDWPTMQLSCSLQPRAAPSPHCLQVIEDVRTLLQATRSRLHPTP